MTDRNCMICKFAVHVDFGYSNYTVEGTTFHCAKRIHPDGEFDEWYSNDKRLEYAKECVGFEEGEGPKIDVECYDVADLTAEQKAIYEMLSQ